MDRYSSFGSAVFEKIANPPSKEEDYSKYSHILDLWAALIEGQQGGTESNVGHDMPQETRNLCSSICRLKLFKLEELLRRRKLALLPRHSRRMLLFLQQQGQ